MSHQHADNAEQLRELCTLTRLALDTTGLEHLSSLKHLDLCDNALTNVNNLASLTQLEWAPCACARCLSNVMKSSEAKTMYTCLSHPTCAQQMHPLQLPAILLSAGTSTWTITGLTIPVASLACPVCGGLAFKAMG